MASFAHSPDEELFEACTRNDAEAVLRAIARGANPRGSGSNAEPPPLHLCALKGSHLAMSVLLQHGVDFEAKDADGNRALHQAALAPTDEVIDLLIDARATVDPKNADGETPLFLAARKGRTMTVQALLEYGASHAARTELGATPLMACADKGHVQVAQLLLASNADPNAADNFGMTALHWSSHSGHLELAQLLVDAGASMTVRDFRTRSIADVAKNDAVRADIQKILPRGFKRTTAAPAAAAAPVAVPVQVGAGAGARVSGGYGSVPGARASPITGSYAAAAAGGGGSGSGGGSGQSPLRSTRADTQRRLDAALAEIEKLQTQLTIEITRAEDAERRAIDNESRAMALLSELQAAHARVGTLEQALGEASNKAQTSEAALAACQAQLQEQISTSEDLRISAERAEHELGAAQVRVVELSRLLADSNAAVQNVQYQLNFMHNQMLPLQQHRDMLQQQRDALQQQVDGLNTRCSQLTQFAKYANDNSTALKTQLQQLQQQQQQQQHQSTEPLEQKQSDATTSDIDSQWHIPAEQVTLGSMIGKGSLAEVMAARWLGIDIAVKRLFFMHEPTLEALGGLLPADRASVMQSFYRECRINSQLRHPNIVMFLGVGMDSATKEGRFLLLERMHRSLHELIYEQPSTVLPLPVLVSILYDVCSALVYLHSRSPPVLHFDIKPKNVLIDKLNRAKLADLGEAHIVLKNAVLASITRTGIVSPVGIGTELYRSPEMAHGESIKSAKSDMFSFGVLVAEVASGYIPNPTVAYVSSGTMHYRAIPEQERRAADIQRIRYDELRELANHLILHEPGDRWSANEALTYLTQLRQSLPQATTSTSSFS